MAVPGKALWIGKLDACEFWPLTVDINIALCVLVCAQVVCVCFQPPPASDWVLSVSQWLDC